jgi:sulfur carrier protein
MTITVNGRSRTLAEPVTLAQFVQGELSRVRSSSGRPSAADENWSRGTAAAIDGEIVPRTQWEDWQLRPGQALELVTAVQGG